MKRRPLIVFALIVLLPLGALAWAAFQLAENEKVLVQERFRDLMEDRLQDINSSVADYFADVERRLRRVMALNSFEVDALRAINRSQPEILQLFVLNPEGELQYPGPTGDLNHEERMFLIQAAKMFTGQDLKDAVLRAEQGRNTPAPQQVDTYNVPNFPANTRIYQEPGQGPFEQGTGDAPQRVPQEPNAAPEQSRAPQTDQPQVDFPPSPLGRTQQSDPSQDQRQDAQETRTPQTDEQQLPLNVNEPQAAEAQAAQPQSPRQSEQNVWIQQAYQKQPVRNLPQFADSSGWFIWYWDRGLNLILWQRRPSGHIIGCALQRARWISDLIAQLPETVGSNSDRLRSIETRVRLVNSAGSAVYQWGKFEPAGDARPLCEIPLTVPLPSWRLQCFVPADQLLQGTGRSMQFGLFAGLLGLAAALGIGTFFFVREYARDMKQAEQQVSFVNQVSHELKTPLTNIRMYAELLEHDLDSFESDDMERSRRRLEIILSEGQRLSRLIGNVLTYARQKRQSLQIQTQEVSPDEIIRRIVDRFRPALADQQIEIHQECGAEAKMILDPDFLEQILGNLISNVEKYAGSGGILRVTSSIQNGLLTVDISDAGPGIEDSQRHLVFEPFSRVSNDLSYAAGTGIGLPIARELARLHGGDLVLLESETGSLFRATLRDQRTPGD